MAIYELTAAVHPETSSEMVVLSAEVLRDGITIGNWIARFKAGTEDAIIRAEIERRAKDFVKVDKAAIGKDDNLARAAVIASSLQGLDLEKP
jgi:hypothetical protein